MADEDHALALAIARQRRARALASRGGVPQEGGLYSPATASLYEQGQGGQRPDVLDPVQGDPTAVTSVIDNLWGLDNGVTTRGETLGSWINAANESATLGLVGDEAAAFSDSFFGQPYEEALAQRRATEEQFRTDHPYGALSADIAGAFMPGVGLVGTTARAATVPGRMAVGAGAAGAAGGLLGYMEGEGGAEPRTDNAKLVGLLSAGLGGAIPGVAGLIGRGANAVSRNRAIREAASGASPDRLRQEASAIFDRADATATFPREEFAGATQRMVDDAQRFAMDPMLTPQAARVADNMTEAAARPDQAMRWRELDILRRQAGIPAGDVTNRTQAAIGTRLSEGIDEFVENVNPELAGELGRARELWGRLRRSELIEDAIKRAGDQASGTENGLRIQFRHILNSPKLLRGFSEEEVAAIRAVAKGTPFGNLLRLVGTMGAPTDGGRNFLGLMVGGAAGAAGGGIPGMLATAAVGTGARALSAANTSRAANLARDLAAAGGLLAPPAVVDASRGTIGLLQSMAAGLNPILTEDRVAARTR